MTAHSTGTPAGGTGSRSGTLKAKAAEEFRRFVGLFVYLWILFAVFAINQGIVLRQHDIAWSMQGMAFINALVFAKVMMLFEMFDPGRWLRTRPMIYPILYESFLLMILFLVVHVIEKVVEGARPLKRVIQQRVQNPLAVELLKHESVAGRRVRIDYADGDFVFDHVEITAPAEAGQ